MQILQALCARTRPFNPKAAMISVIGMVTASAKQSRIVGSDIPYNIIIASPFDLTLLDEATGTAIVRPVANS
ncbi:hypothetical protein [Burkholderia sp. LMG 21824]|uniref:hypothetical protein n=1 Tax=Burkholderia sp. LMG 21824 TaxID=3158172 RepID=UPI003C2C76F7